MLATHCRGKINSGALPTGKYQILNARTYSVFLLLQLIAVIGRSTSASDPESTHRPLIACVGDSLTAGFHTDSHGLHQRNSYPAYLKKNPLFNDYKVVNYGQGGMCATKSTGEFSYWSTPKYARAMESNPAIVVMMLGTNDAKKMNWNEQTFKQDYTEMILGFQNLPSKPVIYLCIPPPVYSKLSVYEIVPEIVNIELPRVIPEIAQACNVKAINIYIPLGGSSQNFTAAYIIDIEKPLPSGYPNDGVHLSALGYSTVADNVAKQLLADRLKLLV